LGGLAYQLLDDALQGESWAAARGHRAGLSRVTPRLANYDGVLCGSRETAMALLELLDAQQPQRGLPLSIGFLEDLCATPARRAASRDAFVPWQTCFEMLGAFSHRNWLCHWERQASTIAIPLATVQVA